MQILPAVVFVAVLNRNILYYVRSVDAVGSDPSYGGLLSRRVQPELDLSIMIVTLPTYVASDLHRRHQGINSETHFYIRITNM